MDTQSAGNRNYSTISPSAKDLLLMKGLTGIPYAKEAASLMTAPEPYEPQLAGQTPHYWGRVLHFEARYWSIDQLLQGLPVRNILELSSGFSFRGLDMVKKPGIHYIDTDLPEVIATKMSFVDALPHPASGPGSVLELIPLNALDANAFYDVTKRFPEGPLAIVNEGLLIYLDTSEKQVLCQTIRGVLQQRGGYWITADIYIRQAYADVQGKIDDKLSRFLEEHQIRRNMFESPEQAEAFFKEQGLTIDREATIDPATLSALPHLLKALPEEQQQALNDAGKMQLTWRLKLADG